MFRRAKLTRSERDLLILLADRELSNTLEGIRGFGDTDLRRVMRDYIEALEALRTKLASLKCKV